MGDWEGDGGFLGGPHSHTSQHAAACRSRGAWSMQDASIVRGNRYRHISVTRYTDCPLVCAALNCFVCDAQRSLDFARGVEGMQVIVDIN